MAIAAIHRGLFRLFQQAGPFSRCCLSISKPRSYLVNLSRHVPLAVVDEGRHHGGEGRAAPLRRGRRTGRREGACGQARDLGDHDGVHRPPEAERFAPRNAHTPVGASLAWSVVRRR